VGLPLGTLRPSRHHRRTPLGRFFREFDEVLNAVTQLIIIDPQIHLARHPSITKLRSFLGYSEITVRLRLTRRSGRWISTRERPFAAGMAFAPTDRRNQRQPKCLASHRERYSI
jgi:hypothetical protein